MKLYSKKLDSLQSLKEERVQLKSQLQKTNILPNASGANSPSTSSDLFSKLVGGLSSVSLLSSAISTAPKLLKDIELGLGLFDQSDRKATSKTPPKKSSTIIDFVVKEFVGGYLKWKGVVLVYKGIKLAYRFYSKKPKQK